ncbi:transmembrane protein C1orf162 homolog [Anser cygnoides]|uniref:transmembrane protein C1orf162 homolog n=1 Tax=Anser cygnoides TaxID=8845 RepID=UPI0034D1BC14
MGGSSSKVKPVTPATISTTVTVRTTVYTSTAALRDSEGQSFIDNHDILYLALAFVSGILSTVMVFAVIYLLRKKCKRSQENLQEQVPSQAPREESAENVQDEVSYTTVVIKPRPKVRPV